MNHTILPTNEFLEEVRPVIENALAECERVLPSYKEMRIIVQYTEDQFVIEKMGGSTGKAENETTMTVAVNTNTSNWEKSLKGSVIHEYNHLVWHQIHGKTENISLGDLLVTEGFAQHFEEELTGSLPEWASAISEEKAKEVWESIKNYLDEGSGKWWARLSFEDDEYSLWSGYTLAYLIIKKQIEKQNMPWPELMQVKVEELLEF